MLSPASPVEAGVKDTVAYRIIRQITDHTWGSETELSDEDVVHVCLSFSARGGLWEALLGGDMRSVAHLEESIDELVAPRALDQAAVG